MADVVLPHPNLSLITEGEPVSPDVSNRPITQLQENVQSLASRIGSSSAPTQIPNPTPNLGEQWTDIDGVPSLWNGSFWEPLSGMFVQDTKPAYGRSGLFWYDSINHVLYIHNGLYYLQYSSGIGGSGTGGSLVAVPLVPITYDIVVTEGQTTLPFEIVATDSIVIYINNLIADVGTDYTYDTSTITFTKPFSLNQKLKIIKFSTGSTSVNIGIKNTSIPVSTDSTTFPYVQTVGSTSIVSIDGILNNTFQYDASNIIFSDNVPAGVTISIIEIIPSSTSISDSDAIASFQAIFPAL